MKKKRVKAAYHIIHLHILKKANHKVRKQISCQGLRRGEGFENKGIANAFIGQMGMIELFCISILTMTT